MIFVYRIADRADFKDEPQPETGNGGEEARGIDFVTSF